MYLRLEASVLLIHDLLQAVHLQLVSHLCHVAWSEYSHVFVNFSRKAVARCLSLKNAAQL